MTGRPVTQGMSRRAIMNGVDSTYVANDATLKEGGVMNRRTSSRRM